MDVSFEVMMVKSQMILSLSSWLTHSLEPSPLCHVSWPPRALDLSNEENVCLYNFVCNLSGNHNTKTLSVVLTKKGNYNG